ncbi:MAG: thiamine pyrophosphate-binding protein [Anaerolineaceae bacterium]
MAMVGGGEMVIRALEQQGVREVFALSGGHLDPIFQACHEHGLRLIDTRHEAAAAHMADGFARTTGRPGVAIVTAGPGVANAVTGVANAWMDAVPMICIGGRSPLRDEDRLPLQNLDQLALMTPITKYARTVLHPERISEYMATAWRHAVSGRPGPVFLDIPVDVLYTPVDESQVATFAHFVPEGRPAADIASIDRALDALCEAERPCIFAGGGIVFSDAQAELREFAALTRIPVFMNPKARGVVSERSDLGYGSLGLAAHPVAHSAGGGQPDTILMLGARVGMFTGSSGGLGTPSVIPPDATLIQVDIEPEEIGRIRDVQIGLVGDVRETLRLFIQRAKGRQFRDHERWIAGVGKAADFHRSMFDEAIAEDEGPIHQARLVREISNFLGDEAIIVADGGETSQWMADQAIVSEGGHYLSHGYLGCLGVGIPFGLAAKVAHPNKKVLTIVGDGSAGLNIAEFDTAVRHNVPLVTVVNNDQGWGMIRHGQLLRYEQTVGAELGTVRYDEVAAGFGAYSELVTEPTAILPALERAFASGRPACLNVMTDPAQPYRPPGGSQRTARERREQEQATKEVELPYYGRRKLESHA